MAAVDEDREPDPSRAAQVRERVHRGADRPAGEQDVVDEDHRPAGDVEGDPRLVDLGRFRGEPDVVAVEGDVEGSDRDLDALDRGDLPREAEGEVVPSVGDPDEDEAVRAFALDDLVGDPREGAAHVVGTEDRAHTGTPPRACEEAR